MDVVGVECIREEDGVWAFKSEVYNQSVADEAGVWCGERSAWCITHRTTAHGLNHRLSFLFRCFAQLNVCISLIGVIPPLLYDAVTNRRS